MNNYLDLLRGKSCWSIIAGVGSILELGFGDKKKRKQPLKNATLTDEQGHFAPEFSLLIYCAWRLSRYETIMCGWRDSDEFNTNTKIGFDLLKNKKVTDVKLVGDFFDLNIYFEDGIVMQLFCDQTNNYDSDENYTLFTDSGNCTVGLKSIIAPS